MVERAGEDANGERTGATEVLNVDRSDADVAAVAQFLTRPASTLVGIVLG